MAEPDPTPTSDAATPSVTTFPRPADPDEPLRAAIEEAKRLNQPVAVEAVYTETSRTWAYPDGHLTLQSYAGPSQLKQPDGSWAFINTDLIEQDGVLKPKLAKADISFSLGGDAPFASMERDKGQRFALSWLKDLPRPEVSGNVARYIDAAGPGADLVLTALPTGFRHDVVLRERPTGPVEYRIPVATEGLSLAEGKKGKGLTLVDGKGKQVASAVEPVMVEAGPSPAEADSGKATPPRTGTIDTQVVQEQGQQVLVLKPDPAFLSDPTTRYPLTVDPTTTLPLLSDQVIGSDSIIDTSPAATKLETSKARTYTDGHLTFAHSMLKFDTSVLNGRSIGNAKLEMYVEQDVACRWYGPGGVEVKRITSGWKSDTVTWSTQPAVTSFGSSIQICPSTPSIDDNGNWIPRTNTWDITAMANAWAAGAQSEGIQVSAYTDYDHLPTQGNGFWVYYHSAERVGGRPPKLTVNYWLPPEIPTVTAESIDSLTGNDAIARSQSVKVGFKSAVPEATNLDYTVTVNDSTMVPPPAYPTGHVAHWKFDEAAGATTAADASGNGYTATYTGTRHAPVTGKVGGAVHLNNLDGSPGTLPDSYASTSKPVLNQNSSFSISTWVKLHNSEEIQFVASQDGSPFGLAIYYLGASWQKWRLQVSGTGGTTGYGVWVDSQKLVTADSWSHLVAMYDASAAKIRLYVDGVLSAETDYTPTGTVTSGPFRIGSYKPTSSIDRFQGSLDDMRLYQRALTVKEIKDLYGEVAATSYNAKPSGQVINQTFALDNPASLKFVVKACRSGVTPPSCNESPAYRLTSDAPMPPSDTETGMADPAQPILSAMVNRPSGGPVSAKYYLYDNSGAPVGAAPLGSRTVNGGERASFQVPADTVQPGSTYTWQMTACVSPPPTNAAPLNSNPFFESSTAPWTTTGGALARSTDQHHEGTASAVLTPNGTAEKVYAYSEKTIPVQAGATYNLQGWFLQPTTDALLNYWVSFYDTSGAYLTGFGGTQDLNQGQWTAAQKAVIAPANATKAGIQIILGNTPTPQTVLYMDEVTLTGTTPVVTGPDVCTAKTTPVSFTTPGTPPPPPTEDVRHLTLGKDNFVIKTAKTDPTACNSAPCTVTDDTVMRIGGTGTDKAVSVIGLRLDELPDGALVSEGILKLGTPTCPAGTCPADAIVTATSLKSAVTSETKGSDLVGDVDAGVEPYSLPLSGPQADVAGSEYQWLMLTSNKDETIAFGDAAAAEQPSVVLTYLMPGPPSPVVNLAAQAGDRGAVATWGLPETTGSTAMLDGYDVRVQDAGTVVRTIAVTNPSTSIGGLANDVTYTIDVRARTAIGAGEWVSTTVTPKAPPPDPTPPPGSESCDVAKYEAIIKDYQATIDSVIQGHAGNVWEGSAAAPTSPTGAILAVANPAVINEKTTLQGNGVSISNLTTSMSDLVPVQSADGSVKVFVTITRTADVTKQPAGSTTLAGPASASGTVEGQTNTKFVSISFGGPCGTFHGVLDGGSWGQDPSDFVDDDDLQAGGSGGPTPPCNTAKKTWIASDLKPDNYGIDCLGGKRVEGLIKGWYFSSRYSAYFNPLDYGDARGRTGDQRWDIRDVVNYMRVDTQDPAYPSANYTTAMRKHMRLKLTGQTCFLNEKSTTEVTQNAQMGLSIDGVSSPNASLSANASVSQQIKYEIGEMCKPYESSELVTNGTVIATKPNSPNECLVTHLDACTISRFAFYYENELYLKFKLNGAWYRPRVHHVGACFVTRVINRWELEIPVEAVYHRSCTATGSDLLNIPPWSWGHKPGA